MQSSRRSVLKASGLAALLGVVGTAGCLETVDDAVGDTPDTPGYATWLYDTAEVSESNYMGFGRFDVQSVYKNQEAMPDEMMDDIESANEETEFVDLEAMETMTGIAYGQPNRNVGGGSMVVAGEFDVEAITAEIEKESPDGVETGSHGDYTLYTIQQERQHADEGPNTNSATVAVSSEHVLIGGMQASDVTSEEAVTTMIETENGDVARLHEGNENASELISQLGEATLVMGGTFDANLTNFTDEETPDEGVKMVDDLVGVGVASNVNGDTVEHTMAFVYEDSVAASADDVQEAIETAANKNDRAENQLEDRSVSEDGRTVLVSATGETDAMVEAFGLFGFGLPEAGTAVASESGSDSASQPTDVPQVSFDFEYRDDGTVQITHQGGDQVDGPLDVRYEHDGTEVIERWESANGIMAGTRYVTDRTPDPGSQVLLVWKGDGQSAVLGSFTVPG